MLENLQLTGDFFPILQDNSGQKWSHLSRHPSYCTVCLNLYPQTAHTTVPRPDITYDDRLILENEELKQEHVRLRTLEPRDEQALQDFNDRFSTWSFAAATTDMAESARNGCQTCQMLTVCVDALFPAERVMSDVLYELLITFSNGCALDCALRKHSPCEEGDAESDDGMFGLVIETAASSTWSATVSPVYLPGFNVYTVPGSPSPWPSIGSDLSIVDPGPQMWKGGLARNIEEAPMSPKVLSMVQSWINTCFSKHQYCIPMRAHALPTRVVDVGTNADFSDIRLCETDHTEGQYLALSHCWGIRPILRTLKANFSDHATQIVWPALSKTFQDAIQMTRALGFTYLWIDSLCIVQDDAEDWEREAATMASIYQNAGLVLSATASVDGAGGCLFPRQTSIAVKGSDNNGKPFTIYVRKRIDHESTGWGVERTSKGRGSLIQRELEDPTAKPLLNRAWCFQERHLGQRIIHFTRSELVWECLTCTHCECGALEDYKFDPILETKQYAAGVLSSDQSDEDTFHDWRTLVTQYSRKGITYRSDTLPAVSALASRFAKPFTGEYLAGLWRNDLYRGLLWKPVDLPRRAADSNTAYVAPSWSWASSQRPVEWIRQNEPATYYFEVIDARCTAQPTNPFGKVTDGFVRLSGSLLEAELCRTRMTAYASSTIAARYGSRNYGSMDDPAICEKLIGERVYCLKYRRDIVNVRAGSGFERALILRKVTSPESIAKYGLETYQRIGVMEACPDQDFSAEGDAWVNATDRQELTII